MYKQPRFRLAALMILSLLSVTVAFIVGGIPSAFAEPLNRNEAPSSLRASSVISVPTFVAEPPISISPVPCNSAISILGNDAFTAQRASDYFWMGGGVFATARQTPVGVMFRWEGDTTGKRMCDDIGDPSAINARPCVWPSTSDSLKPGLYCMAADQIPGYTRDQICQLVAGINSMDWPQSLFSWPNGTLTAGLGWEQVKQAQFFAVRDIRLIYSDTLPALPLTTTLSNSGPKGGFGGLGDVSDPRECPVTGCNGAQGAAGDPINTLTGGFDLSVTDLALPSLAGPLVFQRTYASPATGLYTTPLGYGWTHNQDTRLIFGSGQVWFKAHSANQYYFTDNGAGVYTPFAGVLASLTRSANSPYTYVLTNSAQAVYTFDSSGRLLTWADPLGHVLTYTYASGRLSRVADSTGQRYLDFAYNPQGQLTTVSDPANRRVSFGYNAAGDLITVTDVLSQSWRYTYDAAHRLTYAIDPNGTTILRTDYDSQGRAIRQYDALNTPIVQVGYLSASNMTVITDALGRVVTHTYSNRNVLVAAEDAAGRALRAQDANFRPTYTADANGNVTQQTWSANGANLTQAVDAAGNRTRMVYDNRNHLLSATDARGYTTTYSYQGNLLITTTDALSGTVVNAYNAQNLLARVVAHGITTTYGYDSLGQQTVMTDALGNITRFGYDAIGRRVAITDANGVVTRYQYDALSRLLAVTESFTTTAGLNPAAYNVVTRYGYDAVGNRTVVTDARGYTTTYTYDALNRLTSERDPLGNTTRYGYDIVSNRTVMTDANNAVTRYAYDALNRLTVITYTAEATTVKYAYDKVGNRVAMTDSTGVTTYVYDSLYQLVTVTAPYSGSVGYRYDSVGNRTRLIYPDGKTITYTYDALNRLNTVTDWASKTTRYAYDAGGRPLTTTLPNGITTTYRYDRAGWLVNLAHTGRWSLSAYTYTLDATGNRIAVTEYVLPPTPFNYLPIMLKDSSGGGAMTMPQGVPSSVPAPFSSPLPAPAPQTFTSPLPPPSGTTSNGASRSSPVLPDISLLLLAPLLIVVIVHRRKGRRWSEPAATVLLAVTVVIIGMTLSGGGATPAVAIPAPRPFLSPQSPPPGCTPPTAPITGTRVISYTYDPLGRLSQVAQSDGMCYQYKYDPVGNRTAMTTTTSTTTYAYDAANRLTSVGGQTYTWDNAGNLTNNGKFTFTYNTAGQMTRAQGITATQVYTYNGDGLLISRNTAKYVYDQAAGLPQLLSDGSKWYVPGVGQWDGKEWLYELPDGLGSVRQLADAQGYIAQRYEYGPFGEMLASEGKRANSLRYTGEPWDSDVGLLYLRARWYDPSVGRFTTRDPFRGFAALPQSQNPYVYVYNNPINLTDPSGNSAIVIGIVVVSVGAIVVIGGWVILSTYYFSPYAAQNRANFASGMCELGRGIQNRYNEAMAWPMAIVTLGATYLSQNMAFASRYTGDKRSADQIIGADKKGSIRSEFPSEWLNKTYDEIKRAAEAGDRVARTAKKLLDSKEYDKGSKK